MAVGRGSMARASRAAKSKETAVRTAAEEPTGQTTPKEENGHTVWEAAEDRKQKDGTMSEKTEETAKTAKGAARKGRKTSAEPGSIGKAAKSAAHITRNVTGTKTGKAIVSIGDEMPVYYL